MARREQLLPNGRRLVNLPRGTPSPGDILTWRRKRGGWTHADIARADGAWTPLEVAEVEGSTGAYVDGAVRYLRALTELEKSTHLIQPAQGNGQEHR